MTETSLHSILKDWYSLANDKVEVKVDGFVVDIVRDDLLIEIQTKNFYAIKKKLWSLVKNHNIRLVHPIAKRKWIIRELYNNVISRRKSPKKGQLIDLFDELIRIPHIIAEDNFSLEILMIEEEEVRINDRKGSWRRRGESVLDRKLLEVISRIEFKNKTDFLRFIPDSLKEPFSNKTLAKEALIPIRKSRKITYCLKKMNVIREIGKNRNELLFVKLSI
jgi:hypothetical protein